MNFHLEFSVTRLPINLTLPIPPVRESSLMRPTESPQLRFQIAIAGIYQPAQGRLVKSID